MFDTGEIARWKCISGVEKAEMSKLGSFLYTKLHMNALVTRRIMFSPQCGAPPPNQGNSNKLIQKPFK